MTEAKKNYLRTKRFPLYRYKFRGGKYRLRQNMDPFKRNDSFNYRENYKWANEYARFHNGQFTDSVGYQWWVQHNAKVYRIADLIKRRNFSIDYIKEIKGKIAAASPTKVPIHTPQHY